MSRFNFGGLRPTIDTLFHIDWSWFERNQFNAEQVIRNQLSEKVAKRFPEGTEVATLDYIDPETGEVSRVDAMREAIMAECQWEPDYISPDLPLIQNVLRIFLANNNQPLNSVQLAQRLGRMDGESVLRLLISGIVPMGVVPLR